MDEIFLRLLDSLCNGDGHLRGFAFADADPSLSVTDHHEGAKIEPLAALHNLRNTVDENDFVFEA
jgi:hypothetical protein